MFKEPFYVEEGLTEIKDNKKLIIFCVVIAIVTIAIVVVAGVLVYKNILNNNAIAQEEAMAMTGESTVGTENFADPNVRETPVPSISTEPVDEPKEEPVEPVETPKIEIDTFPAHDVAAAMESQLPSYSVETNQKVVDVYFNDEKKIYLTFDDGPSARTLEVLEILKKYDVKATFFMLGMNIDANPDIAKKVYEEGHFIASHGYSHVYSSIYETPENVVAEHNHCVQAIRNAIGVPNYNPHLFRFPGGSSGGPYHDVKQIAIDLLEQNETCFTNWSCLTGDSAGSETIEQMWATFNESVADDKNSVVLMHDAGNKYTTVEFLPQLIEKYQKAGYQFCSYYDVITAN